VFLVSFLNPVKESSRFSGGGACYRLIRASKQRLVMSARRGTIGGAPRERWDNRSQKYYLGLRSASRQMGVREALRLRLRKRSFPSLGYLTRFFWWTLSSRRRAMQRWPVANADFCSSGRRKKGGSAATGRARRGGPRFHFLVALCPVVASFFFILFFFFLQMLTFEVPKGG